jgi:hypothetical protein
MCKISSVVSRDVRSPKNSQSLERTFDHQMYRQFVCSACDLRISDDNLNDHIKLQTAFASAHSLTDSNYYLHLPLALLASIPQPPNILVFLHALPSEYELNTLLRSTLPIEFDKRFERSKEMEDIAESRLMLFRTWSFKSSRGQSWCSGGCR